MCFGSVSLQKNIYVVPVGHTGVQNGRHGHEIVLLLGGRGFVVLLILVMFVGNKYKMYRKCESSQFQPLGSRIIMCEPDGDPDTNPVRQHDYLTVLAKRLLDVTVNDPGSQMRAYTYAYI